HHQRLRALEGFARIALAAEPVLVGHDHEAVAGIAQLQQRGDHAGHEAKLVVGVDLEVLGLLDEGAVAVDEEDGGAHARASARQAVDRTSSTRAFCAGVPTVMRSASPSCGAARWPRTTTPAASSTATAS